MSEFNSRWVFFDAGDTFIYGYPTLYDALIDCCREQGIEVAASQVKQSVQAYFAQNPPIDFTRQDRFEAYFRALYRHLLTEAQYPPPLEPGVEYLWSEWRSARRLRLFDDARGAFRLLHEAGYRLGVISNWDDSFEGALKRLDAWEPFEIHIASCLVGLSKPDPAIFHHALEMAQTQPSQSWYVGDQVDTDIEPAHQIGMKTVCVDYFDKVEPDEAAIANAHLPSISLAAWHIIQHDRRAA